MNITLRQLSYFKALSEQRNFGRAAATVNVSQPALSVQIREMEASLGAQLVERRARDIVLTPFGRRILDHATRVLTEMQALTEAARWQDGLAGRLSLGIIPTVAPYILPGVLEALRSRDISLDVKVREARTDQLVAEVQAGQLDAAILALPVPRRDCRRGRSSRTGSLSRAARRGWPRSDRGRCAAPDIAGSDLASAAGGRALPDRSGARGLRARRGHAQIDMGASSLSTLSRLVAAGFGLTLMPEIAATPRSARRRASIAAFRHPSLTARSPSSAARAPKPRSGSMNWPIC